MAGDLAGGLPWRASCSATADVNVRAVSGTSASVHPSQASASGWLMDHVVVAVLVAVAAANLNLSHNWTIPNVVLVDLHCSLHLLNAHGSADTSVMAPSPFAAVGAVEAVGAVGALEAVGCVVLSPASPSPGGGTVGGGAAACSPTVSQEEEEVVWAVRGACPHASHALARGAVPATASGPFAHLTRAHETLGSSRDSLAWRCSSCLTP